MGNRLTRDQIEAMFAVYAKRQSVEDVARKCGHSHVTVERYREKEHWDRRLEAIRANLRATADYSLAQAMTESLQLAREYEAKLAVALAGKTVTSKEVTASELKEIAKLKAYLLDGVESRHEIRSRLDQLPDEELERIVAGETDTSG